MPSSRSRFAALLLGVILIAPAAAIAKDPAESSREPFPEEGRRGHLTYRERINLLTRKPLQKAGPEAPRQGMMEHTGIHDAPPPIARQVPWFKKKHQSRSRHVDNISRGPLVGPFETKK